MPADHPFGILNFGHCYLFDICVLLFEFFRCWNLNPAAKHRQFLTTCCQKNPANKDLSASSRNTVTYITRSIQSKGYKKFKLHIPFFCAFFVLNPERWTMNLWTVSKFLYHRAKLYTTGDLTPKCTDNSIDFSAAMAYFFPKKQKQFRNNPVMHWRWGFTWNQLPLDFLNFTTETLRAQSAAGGLFFIQSGDDDWIKLTLPMNQCFFFTVARPFNLKIS